MMKRKIASIVIAGAGLIFCSGVWAWSSDGDKIKFTDAEFNFCRDWESDAASIMLARQEGVDPPVFVNDVRREPTDFDKRRREYFFRESKSYQIAGTPKERMAVAKNFSVQMRHRCYGVVTSTPPTKEP